MEAVTLTTPEVTPATATTDYRVTYLLLEWERGGLIVIHLRGTHGERKEVRYTGPEAVAMMRTLNTANLTTKSLHKRILEKLVADGKIAGTITGTPDA
jgi:hypothetical protein